MGARAYIPQLGRFEQTDPQPGGFANAYAYTDDDPVNESDSTGECTSTITYNTEAVDSGPAAAGLAQEYAGPGAIYPPPVNMQIEEEFNAHPPWGAPAQAAAATGGGGDVGDGRFGRFANLVDTDDNGPDVESECNKTGQGCSGHRGGGSGGGGSVNLNGICEGAGFGAAIKVVTKQALGPAGTVVTVACGVYGGVELVKQLFH